MRLHRCMPVLATVVALAGVSAPVAQASQAMAPEGGGSVQAAAPTVAQPHSAGPDDWIIGIGAATGILVLGTGVAATRRNRRVTVAGSSKTRPAS